MSFILDALKKSEIERRRQTVPGLMDTRVAPRRRRLPAWAIALAALLAVNLVVLVVVLMRGNTASVPPTPAAHAQPQSQSLHPIDRSAAVQAVPPAPDHFSPLDTAPVYAPEIPVPIPDQRAGYAAPSARSSVAARTRPVRRPDPLLIEEDSAADNQELLPTINEISVTGTQALPDLHLDVHVYATRPAERFVYINMRKYHEGSTVQEGLTLERIRRDGVVLNFQGLRFILPRQP